MFFRTNHLLNLININSFDDDIENIVIELNNPLILEVFKYESFKNDYINSLNYDNLSLKIEEYLNQMNLYRLYLNDGFNKVLNLNIKPNLDTFFFESNYPMYNILSLHKLAIGDIGKEIFDICGKTEDTHHFCLRYSFIRDFKVIEYSIFNFGLLLLDIFEHNQEIKISLLYEQLKEQYGDEINEIFLAFLSQNIVNNYSLLVFE